MANLADITNTLRYLSVAAGIMAGLLILVKAAEAVLRLLARHHVTRTDLDLIGREAVVTSTIRPTRPGKIYCQNVSGEDCVADALSDRVIRRGEDVLITAIEETGLRVVLLSARPGGQGDKQ